MWGLKISSYESEEDSNIKITTYVSEEDSNTKITTLLTQFQTKVTAANIHITKESLKPTIQSFTLKNETEKEKQARLVVS